MLSQNPCEIFSQISRKDLAGFKYQECIECMEKKIDIHGIVECDDKGKPFVLINMNMIENPYIGTALIFHEMMKLAFIIFNGYHPDDQANLLAYAEGNTLDAIDLIRRHKLDTIQHN